MSACTHLCKIFELLCFFFISMCLATRNCSSYKSSDYIQSSETANNFAFGDCSFSETLCNYTQACTDGVAQNWAIYNGRAVCPGFDGLFNSFSILMSPLLKLQQKTSISFSYFQTNTGTLSVFLVTSTEITEVLPEKIGSEGNFSGLLFIGPSILKIGFRARKANSGSNVTLSDVKLQVDSYTPNPGHVTITAKSPLYSQSASHSSTQTSTSEVAEDTGGNNAAIVAGVVVPVVVVVAVVVVGVFIWRRGRQQLHREGVAAVGNARTEDTREVSHTPTGSTGPATQHTNNYDVMNFEAASDDVHVYDPIRR